MNIKKRYFLSLFVALPMTFSLTSCWYNKEKTYLTSAFYNSYDMLTALGVVPHTQNYSNYGFNETKYYPYMQEFIDENNLPNFQRFGTSVENPNLQLLDSFQTYTLVLNEWDRPNSNKYLQNGLAATKLAFTSMADTENSTYSGEKNKYLNSSYKKDTSKNGYFNWHNYKDGTFSHISAFKMLATDLDKIYGESYWFLNRVEEIEKKHIQLINDLRTQIENNSNLKSKKIGIFAGQDGGGGYAYSPEIKAIYDPFMYSWIYGKEDIGLGFDFAKPKNETNLKWADEGSLSAIQVTDKGSLLESFESSFDFIIYVKSPNITDDQLKKHKNELTKFLISTTSQQTENNNKIVEVDWMDWYPAAWGPLGVKTLINKFVEILNNNWVSDPNKKIQIKNDLDWKPIEKTELKKIEIQ